MTDKLAVHLGITSITKEVCQDMLLVSTCDDWPVLMRKIVQARMQSVCQPKIPVMVETARIVGKLTNLFLRPAQYNICDALDVIFNEAILQGFVQLHASLFYGACQFHDNKMLKIQASTRCGG